MLDRKSFAERIQTDEGFEDCVTELKERLATPISGLDERLRQFVVQKLNPQNGRVGEFPVTWDYIRLENELKQAPQSPLNSLNQVITDYIEVLRSVKYFREIKGIKVNISQDKAADQAAKAERAILELSLLAAATPAPAKTADAVVAPKGPEVMLYWAPVGGELAVKVGMDAANILQDKLQAIGYSLAIDPKGNDMGVLFFPSCESSPDGRLCMPEPPKELFELLGLKQGTHYTMEEGKAVFNKQYFDKEKRISANVNLGFDLAEEKRKKQEQPQQEKTAKAKKEAVLDAVNKQWGGSASTITTGDDGLQFTFNVNDIKDAKRFVQLHGCGADCTLSADGKTFNMPNNPNQLEAQGVDAAPFGQFINIVLPKSYVDKLSRDIEAGLFPPKAEPIKLDQDDKAVLGQVVGKNDSIRETFEGVLITFEDIASASEFLKKHGDGDLVGKKAIHSEQPNKNGIWFRPGHGSKALIVLPNQYAHTMISEERARLAAIASTPPEEGEVVISRSDNNLVVRCANMSEQTALTGELNHLLSGTGASVGPAPDGQFIIYGLQQDKSGQLCLPLRNDVNTLKIMQMAELLGLGEPNAKVAMTTPLGAKESRSALVFSALISQKTQNSFRVQHTATTNLDQLFSVRALRKQTAVARQAAGLAQRTFKTLSDDPGGQQGGGDRDPEAIDAAKKVFETKFAALQQARNELFAQLKGAPLSPKVDKEEIDPVTAALFAALNEGRIEAEEQKLAAAAFIPPIVVLTPEDKMKKYMTDRMAAHRSVAGKWNDINGDNKFFEGRSARTGEFGIASGSDGFQISLDKDNNLIIYKKIGNRPGTLVTDSDRASVIDDFYNQVVLKAQAQAAPVVTPALLQSPNVAAELYQSRNGELAVKPKDASMLLALKAKLKECGLTEGTKGLNAFHEYNGNGVIYIHADKKDGKLCMPWNARLIGALGLNMHTNKLSSSGGKSPQLIIGDDRLNQLRQQVPVKLEVVVLQKQPTPVVQIPHPFAAQLHHSPLPPPPVPPQPPAPPLLQEQLSPVVKQKLGVLQRAASIFRHNPHGRMPPESDSECVKQLRVEIDNLDKKCQKLNGEKADIIRPIIEAHINGAKGDKGFNSAQLQAINKAAREQFDELKKYSDRGITIGRLARGGLSETARIAMKIALISGQLLQLRGIVPLPLTRVAEEQEANLKSPRVRGSNLA